MNINELNGNPVCFAIAQLIGCEGADSERASKASIDETAGRINRYVFDGKFEVEVIASALQSKWFHDLKNFGFFNNGWSLSNAGAHYVLNDNEITSDDVQKLKASLEKIFETPTAS